MGGGEFLTVHKNEKCCVFPVIPFISPSLSLLGGGGKVSRTFLPHLEKTLRTPLSTCKMMYAHLLLIA